MASSARLYSFTANPKPGDCPGKCGARTGTLVLRHRDQKPLPARFHVIKTKAASNDRNTKKNSMICGAVLCSQCKGGGVNSEDVFNGRFKVGDSCWLCGRKEMLCGNCNGAGFMSTYDE